MQKLLMSCVLFAAVSGCVAAPGDEADPATSAQSQAELVIQQPPSYNIEATATQWWTPGTNTIDDLWPLDRSPTITSVQVLIRAAADDSNGHTFVAFVVWNGNFVGRIFRAEHGTNGSDFNMKVASLNGQRAYGHSDYSVSTNGNPSAGGGKPTPHPNIDGYITYVPNDIINTKNNAVTLLSQTLSFQAYAEVTP